MTMRGTATFGELLRYHRLAATLSQEALAERAHLSCDAIRALESGRRRAPRPATVTLLAEALKLGPAERDDLVAVATGVAPPGQARAVSAPPGALVMPPLPAAPTPLIGREQQVKEAATLLQSDSVRLLTLTGPGGVGKTRLALALATELRSAYTDGAAFIDLSALRDPSLVLVTVAQALGVQEAGARDVTDLLQDHLRARQMLLVLDNVEQVVTAARSMAELVEACPLLALLVTSRIALRVRAEQQYAVPPLAVPAYGQRHERSSARQGLAPGEDAARYPALRLFVERARAMQPDFALDASNRAAVAEICARLDGLPLAIELAAARVALLSPAALLQRLQRRLAILTGGPRDTPDRHRTLRAAIDWSYELLTLEEQRLFRCLAVFAGGCTLDAAEEIGAPARGTIDLGAGHREPPGQAEQGRAIACADSSPWIVEEGLASLLDKSLLRRRASGEEQSRFIMLETLREYALERLEASGEADAVRLRHAHYFLALAEQAHQNVEGPEQLAWLRRLEEEHDNLRAALDWTLERGDVEMALRLSGALWDFWELRGHWSEGRRWLGAALAAESKAPLAPASRVRALLAATDLARLQGDFGEAQCLAEESLTLAQHVEDNVATADALVRLGHVARHEDDYARAHTLFARSLELYRDHGDKAGMRFALTMCGATAECTGDYAGAHAFYRESLAVAREMNSLHDIAANLTGLGRVAYGQEDLVRAQALFEEALALQQQIEDKNCSAHSLRGLGEVALARGDFAAAQRLLEQSQALYHEVDARGGSAAVHGLLGRVALVAGDAALAAQLYATSLRIRWELSDKRGIASCLEGWAEVALARDRPEQVIRLGAAAAVLRAAMGAPLPPVERAWYEQTQAAARARRDEAVCAAAWDEGCTRPLGQVIDEVLATEFATRGR